ncbi:MAG: LuxR C-terminal-related transcriptional regulator [Polyangia bacterium]|jgi:DNA-binding CsgD family transcriptional regulator
MDADVPRLQETRDLLERVQELLCSGKLARFLPKRRDLPRCWQVLDCKRKRCPIYGTAGTRCWQTVGTMCAPHSKPAYSIQAKWPDCRDCPVYRSALTSDEARIEEALSNIAHWLTGVAGSSLRDAVAIRRSFAKLVEQHGLSTREAEVLHHLCLRRSRKEMAARLRLSDETVKMHVKHVYRKLGIGGSRELQRTLADLAVHQR